MNREQYNSDPRYAKVLEQMDLLKITDVSTTRQSKNGTIVWKLPVKHPHGGQLIKVASFKSGYVRNQNCCYSNYQLNKCKPHTEYYKDYKWNEECTKQIFTGKYRKFTGTQRILIPIEIDRLEYLIAFCLKNYYIAYANQVANGDFVTKWSHEWELKQAKKAESEWLIPKHKYDEKEKECKRLIGEASQYNDCGHYERIRNLEVKLDTIKRISDHE